MSEYTRAPWILHYSGTIYGNNDEEVVCSFDWSSFKEFNDRPEYKATARLIAAAPEMLEALKALLNQIETPGPGYTKAREAIQRAEDVLAKATKE